MVKVRVFLAEYYPVVRAGLKALLRQPADLEVIGEAGDGELAVAEALRLRPDVVVIGISLPLLNGTDVARAIKRQGSPVKILGLSENEDALFVREFIAAGASGYVLKRGTSEELINAVRSVHRGEMPIDQRVLARMLPSIGKPSRASDQPTQPLTAQEAAVIRSVARGFANKEIADKMGVSVKSVETYKARAMQKVSLQSRVDIVRYANERGWLLEQAAPLARKSTA